MHANAVGIAALVCALGLASAISAEPGAEPRLPAPDPIAAAPAANGEVDESALRYFASLRQTERVDAEINRLKRLYPHWNPPANIYEIAEPGTADEEELWALFSLDKIVELRHAIERRKAENPEWKPSRDLASKLARKELRLKILSFSAKNETEALISYIKETPHKPEDLDLDLQWLVAETFARAKQTEDARKLYQMVLDTHSKPEDRTATIQKAIGALPMSQVEMLLASDKDARVSFASIWPDITRARISAFLHEDRAEEVPEADVADLNRIAMESKDPGQSGLLAWYAFKRQRSEEALELFKDSLGKGGDAMIAHGLAHSLKRLGLRREAEEVSYAWREPLVHNAILFIDTLAEDLTREVPVMIENERLSRYMRVVMQTESGPGAQALAWYAYNSCQYEVALPWFERAAAWHPKSATMMGYALTLQKLRKRRDAIILANRYDGLFGELVTLIFPDGARPPSACDPVAQAQRTTRDPLPTPSVPWALTADTYNTPATPQETASMLRRIKRSEFPIPVEPENPLRYTASGSFAAASGPWLHDPAQGPYPQVARRVPGVGPMPYERYGFSLLPGWNGSESATWPPATADQAPAGTLWADHAKAQGGPSAMLPVSRTRP